MVVATDDYLREKKNEKRHLRLVVGREGRREVGKLLGRIGGYSRPDPTSDDKERGNGNCENIDISV